MIKLTADLDYVLRIKTKIMTGLTDEEKEEIEHQTKEYLVLIGVNT